MTWRRESFIYANPTKGPTRADGITYNGLGLVDLEHGDWRVVHINTGFTLCYLHGCPQYRAMGIATEFAEAGDWDFAGPNGWQNLSPELMQNCAEIGERFEKYVDWGDNRTGTSEVAQAVNAARLN